jgi:hypothetical protein
MRPMPQMIKQIKSNVPILLFDDFQRVCVTIEFVAYLVRVAPTYCVIRFFDVLAYGKHTFANLTTHDNLFDIVHLLIDKLNLFHNDLCFNLFSFRLTLFLSP